MITENARMELLRELKQKGVLNVGTYQIASGEYIINDKNKKLKVDKLLTIVFPQGNVKTLCDHLDLIFDKNCYYWFVNSNISLEPNTNELIAYKSANDMISVLINVAEEVQKASM